MRSTHDVLVYTDDKIDVCEWSGSLYMYWKNTDVRIATAINGYQTLTRYHGGDILRWFKSVQKRELETMNSYRAQAEELLKKVEYIEKMNNFKGGDNE